MPQSPGDGRSPSTLDKAPPSPTRTPPSRPPRTGGTSRWPRSASAVVVRLGLLFGGLVIILDLFFMLLVEGSVSVEDQGAFSLIDVFLNVVLFSILGVLVVRQTRIAFAGVIAGLFAGLLDAIVVTAAWLMVPPPQTFDVHEQRFVQNVVVGAVFAGLSGLVFTLMERWSGGQRPR